jgi:hypothetical protein
MACVYLLKHIEFYTSVNVHAVLAAYHTTHVGPTTHQYINNTRIICGSAVCCPGSSLSASYSVMSVATDRQDEATVRSLKRCTLRGR